jgi:hypothetical protein
MYRVFMETMKEFPELFSQVFNVVGSSRLQESITGVTGLGFMQEIDEGETFPTDRLLPGFGKTFRHKQWAMLVEITKLAMQDDMDGVFNSVPRAMARSVRATKETFFWNILNNGLASVGTETTPDGVSVFNTAHPYVDPLAGTFSNYATTDIAPDSLETAFTSFLDQTDDRGKPIVVNGIDVWVSSTDVWPAARIFDSPQTVTTPGLPDASNDNAINAFSKVVPNAGYDWSPYITDVDSWFVFATKENHKLMAFMRQDVELDRFSDDRTKNVGFTADMRFIGGAGSAVGIYGNAGTG